MHANSSNKKSASSLPRYVTTTSNNAPDFLYKHSYFLNTEKRKALGTESGGVSFYGTMSTAKQQIVSVTQAPIMHILICPHKEVPWVAISTETRRGHRATPYPSACSGETL